MAMQISQIQREHLTLWYLLQHSISSYYRLLQYFDTVQAATQRQALVTWQQLKLHKNHLQRLQQFHTAQGQQEFQQLLDQIAQHSDAIILREQDHYPENLKPYDDSPPILFIKGSVDLLKQPQIAMVGSRKPSPHGAQVAYDFAHYFAEKGYAITSGLATGIDTASHHGAIKSGQTIAVIATGLDQCYPAANQQLCQQILHTGGAIVTEFLPGTPPRKEYFPHRNRIISALSAATLVVEATLESGSLITAKKAADQGKTVFAIPGHIYSQFHQGCHQLIREGAILVDHPEQVLEDLNALYIADSSTWTVQATKSHHPRTTHDKLVTSKSHQQTATSTTLAPIQAVPEQSSEQPVPEHLQAIYQYLDWTTGISIDELAGKLQQDISALNIALVELELLGLCKQHAGRYLRG